MLLKLKNTLSQYKVLCALVVLGFLPGAEIDICISAFPVIKEKFNLSTFQVEYLLTFNLIFHLISGILVGFIGDKYDRKKSTIGGLMVFIVGCAFALVSNFYFLLIGRILQGIGSAFPMINTSLFVISIYKEKKKQTEMPMTLGGISIVGISVAPAIGAKMTSLIGWSGSFIFLLIFALITMVFLYFFIPENTNLSNENLSTKEKAEIALSEDQNTKQTNRPLETIRLVLNFIQSIKKTMLRNFSFLLDSRIILLTVYLTSGICAYYVYLSMSSILYIEVFGVSVERFGYFQGMTALVFGAVSFLNSKITAKIGTKNFFKISTVLMIIFVLLEAIALFVGLKNPYLFCGMMLFSSAGAVLPINVMYSQTLGSVSEKYRGKLSSILLVARWSAVAFFVQTASYFYDKTIFSTIFINCTMTAFSFVLFFILFKKYKDIRQAFGF